MNVFKALSTEKKAEYAIQLVLLDAIEKGLTKPSEATAFMQSQVFENDVKGYLALMNE
jgi:hypothetical protein